MSIIFKNTMLLTIIQLCSYIIPLVELPFLASVLSVEVLGQIIFLQAIALTLSFFVEYGFNLTASRSLAQNIQYHDDLIRAKLIGRVFQAKIILLSLVTFFFGVVYFLVDELSNKIPIVYLPWMYLSIVGFGFSSFWYFQAYQKMGIATGIEFSTRILYLILILLWIKSDVDAIFVLQIQSICTLLGAFSQFLILYQKEKIIFSKWHEVWQEIKIGWHTFIYKSSSSILASMSVLILGFLASPLAVSYYVSAEKIIRAIIGLTQPVILASYPKFSQLALEDKSQSIHLIKKYCYITILLLIPTIIVLFALAPFVINLFFGSDFYPAIYVLYVLLVLVPLRMLTSIVGHLGLLAAQQDKVISNISLISGLLCLLLGAALTTMFGHMGMAIAVVVTEMIILLLYIKFFRINEYHHEKN